MNRSATPHRAITACRLLAGALLLASMVGCGSDDPQSPPQSQGGASSSGGSPDTAGGDAISGNGGDGGDGGDGGAPTGTAGDAGAPSAPESCVRDSDCDDGLYCNGTELCKSVSPGSDVKVCMRRKQGPCGPSACDEASDSCDCTNPDQDHDNFKVEGCTTGEDFDCDDTEGTRFPHNAEVCGDHGDDHDEDCRDDTIGSKDSDQDNFIDHLCSNEREYQPIYAHSQPPLTNSGTDCDDSNANVHPGAVEICDNLDNNCDGQVDEVAGGQGEAKTFYRDQDGDYWGDSAQPRETLCPNPPLGYSVLQGDCDDTDPRISPAREEICNGVDDDCNGTIDQPAKAGDLMFGQPYDGVTQFECEGASGWKVKTCPPDRLDCDANYQDACETIATTLCNCHGCGKTCAFSCGGTGCEEISAISTGDTHTCAVVSPATANLSTGGSIACWGRNALGQLGDGTTKDSTIPVLLLDAAGGTAIALGERHSCALAAGPRALCWGNNEFGQLGAASTQLESIYPIQVRAPAEWGNPRKIASGTNHACAIYGQGLLACWGFNETGQVGNGDQGADHFVNAPEQVRRDIDGEQSFVEDAAQVVAGELHSCVLANGKVECWGDNEIGQLGEDPGALSVRPFARPVPGLEGVAVDSISAAAFDTCALAGTDVYCWGDNTYGELASEDLALTAATKIALPPNIVSLAVGRFFTCALSADGTARCWGRNEFGQRATAEATPGVAPNLVPLTKIARIFAGDGAQVCAQTDDARTWCWGKNTFGQLGNGTLSENPQPTPTLISALNKGPLCGD